ncbi:MULTISPECIES: C39 family peptidase [Ralstonia]|nr:MULTISPECIES: C39 family peptidase [unclassified Ralstonia]
MRLNQRWSRMIGLCVVCACGVWTAQAHAQEGAIALRADSEMPLNKPVRSMAELRYRSVMRQQQDFSCGAAAVGTLLRYAYGMDIEEKRVIADMMKVSDPKQVAEQGFSMLDMRNYVQTLGFRGRGYRVDMTALRDLAIPVIVLLNLNGYQHFVVVKRAAQGRVFIADPALGNRIMQEWEFAPAWNGLVFAIVGDVPVRADSGLMQTNAPTLRARENAAFAGGALPPQLEFGPARWDLF